MTRRPPLLATLLAGVLLLAACGDDGGDLQVLDARSRMSPMMTGVGAVYLDVVNSTEVDDALVSASVDASVAGRVEIHETFDADAHDHSHDHDDDHDHSHDHDDEAMSDDTMGHGDMADGFAMMGMREIERLDIPAGTTVALVPGGFHLMLLDLAEDLVPGEEFDLTLVFEEAGNVTVTVEVREDV